MAEAANEAMTLFLSGRFGRGANQPRRPGRQDGSNIGMRAPSCKRRREPLSGCGRWESTRKPGAHLASGMRHHHPNMGAAMLSTVLIVLLILMLLGAIPSWPYSRGWGYGPSGLLGIILIVILILALTGRV